MNLDAIKSLFVLLSTCAVAFAPPMRFTYPKTEEMLLKLEWQRDFVRDPVFFKFKSRSTLRCMVHMGKVINIDAQYLLNHSAALMGFYGWYLGNTQGEYVDILRQEHAKSCLGQDGMTPYMRVFEAGGYESSSAHPGIFRADIPADVPRFSIDRFKLDPDEFNEMVAAKNPWVIQFAIDPLSITEHAIKIRGLADAVLPILQIRRDGSLERKSPSGESELAFRVLAAARMKALKGWSEKSRDDVVKDIDAFLNDMADYYHTAIHWMPFSMVNNSIFMGHGNVLYRHFGLYSMPHDGLDYKALSSDYLVFRILYKAAFYKWNPEVRRQ